MATTDHGPTAGDLGTQVQYRLIELLQEREQQLADAQRLARLGSWSWHLGSGEVTWSDELYRIFGEEPDAFVPSPDSVLERIEPGHRRRCAATVQDALDRSGEASFECPIVTPAGPRWVRVRMVVDAAVPGVAVRAHGIIQDVSDEHVAQEQVEELRGLFRALVTHTSDVLTIVDSALRLRYSSPSIVGILGREYGAQEGMSLLDLVHPDDVPDLREALLDVAADPEQTVTVVVRVQHADGTWRTFEAVARNLLEEPGVNGILISSRDITDRVADRVADTGPDTRPRIEVDIRDGAGGGASDGTGRGDPASRAVRRRAATDGLEDLGRAVARGELRLAYQPKVSLVTDRLVGVEALLRWDHPERGLLRPLDFVPMAEATGLIVPVGSWVIEEACRRAARWAAMFPRRRPLEISVNVSALQFGPLLVATVADGIEDASIDPAALSVEVTESVLADVETAARLLQDLADIGVGRAIDDFGTGYSSLAYLKRFELNDLKIDKSFVDGLGEDPNDTAIVAAIVAMAHALELGVVAEGVETPAQRERLRTLGCEVGQGYLFARPGPPEAIEAMLASEADGSAGRRGTVVTDGFRVDRVLVIDDAPDVRQLARLTLTTVGFDVHEAVDGASGLTAARALLPDCVLLDINMPGMSGVEVCRRLREDPATADTTIVMLTATDDAADKVAAYTAGADDYVVKPFSPRDLGGRVQSAMRRRGVSVR